MKLLRRNNFFLLERSKWAGRVERMGDENTSKVRS